MTDGDVFAGDTAFKLYDTYGFPLDLTQDALRSRGVVVDTDAFSKAMEVQKTEARRAWKGTGDAKTDAVWFEIRDAVGATEFLGYETEKAEGVITAMVADGKQVKSLEAGDNAQSSSTRRRSMRSPAVRPVIMESSSRPAAGCSG